MNKLSLYDLSSHYLSALDALTDPEMDLPAEVINDTLEALTDEIEDKAVNVAKFLRNMETTTQAIKEAEAAMAKRRKTLENRINWMKAYLKDNMERTGITKVECPYFKLSLQVNPPAVAILDEAAIPAEFKEPILSWKIDKMAIKEAIKHGDVVPGADLVNGNRLVIK
ncbi:MAG: siphovirus Gp157 family protein [Methylobacter sp.]|nr:siphovirus Gp157 family protein [Methylobacter sp.]